MESDRLKNTSAGPLNSDQAGPSTFQALPTPPVPASVTDGMMALKYRQILDLAAEKLLAFIKRRRPPIHWVSQCGQDRFVVEKIFRRKRQGFFLEIGGGDGRYLSNTLVLETFFDWSGILVEPTDAFDSMIKNRPKANCERATIAGSRKTVRMLEVQDNGQVAINPDAATGNTLLSVMEDIDDAGSGFQPPSFGTIQKSYLVETITLDDLLTKWNAPSTIDYFSFDVEGAEFEILQAFPFDKWKFNCIGVERPSAELDQLLVANKYFLIREGFPLDWFYLHRDFLDQWFETLS